MGLRDTLQHWAAHADRLHAAGQRRWRRLSPFSRRFVIEPYLGWGTPTQLRLGGRVLRDAGHLPTDPSHSSWRNFVEFYKRMESDEVPGAVVRASLGSAVAEVAADDEGHFELTLGLMHPLAPGWHDVTVELLEPRSRAPQCGAACAQVLVPPPTARFGVISDIDDTVLWSNVRQRLRMFAMLARSNPHTRKPFKGVGALYRALHAGANGAAGNPFFYVSSSPWNLYTPLLEFLQLQGLPRGPLVLRDFGEHMLFGGSGHGAHKRRAIERVLSTYPALPFILIGDSGERDPEIYREIVHEHPGRVLAVYIRSVNPDPGRIEAIERLVQEVHRAGVELVLAHDSEACAAHAARRGWIAPTELEAVREDRRLDLAAA